MGCWNSWQELCITSERAALSASPDRRCPMVSRDFACQLEGYGLTTASILYRMPDHRSILQEFIWQEYDLAPRFPELNKFLAFWSANLDGPLYRVRVAHKALLGPAELRAINGEFRLN